jgi:hypothetical protein
MQKLRGLLPELRLYRVFPFLDDADEDEVGHPLHIPTPQGHGRVDNPDHYVVLYASDDPAGAIGEAFGNHAQWTIDLLTGPPVLRKSVRALATYEFTSGAPVLDLDDAAVLLQRDLRPSRVVTQERAITQSWALDIYRENRWPGVRWWSHWLSEWGSFGLWDTSPLTVVSAVPLADSMDEVMAAAAVLNRPWLSR